MKNTFDSLILDIDGTIWNTTQIVAEAWNDAVRPFDPSLADITAQRLRGEFGKPMDEIARDLWPSLTEETRQILLKDCCILEHKAVEANTQDIAYPHAAETIEQISKTVPVFIVSNCQDGYIEQTMRKTLITPYISDFECYGRTGLCKADNISLVIKRNNLKAPVYVGDTQGDCNECKKAGVPFAWASWGFGKADSSVQELKCFEDIKSLFI